MTSSSRPPLSLNAKIAIIVTALLVLVVGAIVAIGWNASDAGAPAPAQPTASAAPGAPLALPPTVDESSHVVDQGGDGAIVVVEFLDFECEVCGVVYPVMEQLREEYRGDITYVVRYFPIPGHLNSMNAAVAAEAAAQQGQFEGMYRMLFETQAAWGELRETRAPLFREYAEQLGLDMAAYDTAVADPATSERVQFDFDRARELGVGGTPTFFIDDEPIQLSTLDDLRTAIGSRVG